MINYINSHYKLTILKDLTSKFHYQNSHQVLKLNSFYLVIEFNKTKVSSNLVNFFVLEWITYNYPNLLTFIKTDRLKKKNPSNGFKITLSKQTLDNFLHKLIFFVLPSLKKKSMLLKKINSTTLSFSLKDIDLFQELTFFYSYFKHCRSIEFTLTSKSSCYDKKNNEFLYLINSYQLPFNYF